MKRPFRLTTFGGPWLADSEGVRVSVLEHQPKRLAILSFLCIETRQRPIHRDRLFGVFWPEFSNSRARNALNQAIHYVRKHLGPGAIRTDDEMVFVESEWIACDAVEFAESREKGDLLDSISTFGGIFLDGIPDVNSVEFEHWLDVTRLGLSNSYVEAVLEYCSDLVGGQDAAAATTVLARATGLLPDSTPLAEMRIRAELARGSAAGAEAAFAEHERHRKLLGLGEPARLAELLKAGPTLLEAETDPRAVVGADAVGNITGTQKFRGPTLRFVAVVAAVGFAFLVAQLVRGEPYSVEEPRRSFMVLPFHVMSPDTGSAWLSEGLAHTLTVDLEGWSEITVVDRGRLTHLALNAGLSLGGALDLHAALSMARETRVGTLVHGTVLKRSTGLEVFVRSYDVASGDLLQEPYYIAAASDDDFRPSVDSVAARLLDLGDLGPAAPDVRAWTTSSLQSYRHYLEGLALERILKYEWGDSLGPYNLAVRADPDFSMAWSRLAFGETFWTCGGRWDTNDDSIRTWAARGVTSSRDLPRRYGQFAFVHDAMVNEHWEAARDTLETILQSDQGDVEAWYYKAIIECRDEEMVRAQDGRLVPRANLNAALRYLARSDSLDPLFGPAREAMIEILGTTGGGGFFGFKMPTDTLPGDGPFIDFTIGPSLAFYRSWSDSIVWTRIDHEIVVTQDWERLRVEYINAAADSFLTDTALVLAQRWARDFPEYGNTHTWLSGLYLRKQMFSEARASGEAELALRGITRDCAETLDTIENPGRCYGFFHNAVVTFFLPQFQIDSARTYFLEAMLIAKKRSLRWHLNTGRAVWGATGRASRILRYETRAYSRRPTLWIYDESGDRVPYGDEWLHFVALTWQSMFLDTVSIAPALDSLLLRWSPPNMSIGHAIALRQHFGEEFRHAFLELSADRVRSWYSLSELPRHWRAFALAREGDTVIARQIVDSILNSPTEFSPSNRVRKLFVLARTNQVLRRHRQAIDVFTAMDTATVAVPAQFIDRSLSYLLRALSYEAVGESELAASSYTIFLDLWKDADPAARHLVERARRSLERLGVVLDTLSDAWDIYLQQAEDYEFMEDTLAAVNYYNRALAAAERLPLDERPPTDEMLSALLRLSLASAPVGQ